MKKPAVFLKNVIALLLAIAFINIYVTDSYCTLTKVTVNNHSDLVLNETEDTHHHDSADETEAAEEHQHDGQEAEEHHHDADQPECDNHHDGKEDDNCCKDNSAAFFSSLVNHSVNLPVLKTTVIAIINYVQSNNELLASNIFPTKGFVIREAPPPKTPDVRIFIRSFII
ncbi:MAG: hypothetical protein ABIT08_08755 [Bacteroidia bacterium]